MPSLLDRLHLRALVLTTNTASSYLTLIRTHGRFLAFGLLLTFLSSFGQTFFVSLFNDSLRAEFGLSHGQIGGTYSLATLASGVILVWLGRRLDTADLRTFTAALCVALAAAAFGMALVPGPTLLLAAFFVLRLTGQGLLSHTALTSMSRYFDAARGKAMAVASLGFPLGEAVLPVLVVTAIATVGWRATWAGVGAFMLALALPLSLLLLRGHGAREAAYQSRLAEPDTPDGGAASTSAVHARRAAFAQDSARPSTDSGTLRTPRQWSTREVLRDRRFPLILPAVIAPGFIVTGFFFHQNHLVDVKGWTPEWFATCFAVFAVGQLITGIAAGPLVDRFGGRRLLALFPLPMGAGLAVLASASPAWVAAVFMLGLGVTAGLSPTVVGAMWAEVYGVLHLGAIRAMAQSIMVFGTAASPVLMGVLIDGGVGMNAMAWGAVGWVILAAAGVAISGVGRLGR